MVKELITKLLEGFEDFETTRELSYRNIIDNDNLMESVSDTRSQVYKLEVRLHLALDGYKWDNYWCRGIAKCDPRYLSEDFEGDFNRHYKKIKESEGRGIFTIICDFFKTSCTHEEVAKIQQSAVEEYQLKVDKHKQEISSVLAELSIINEGL